jgi:hypothetical protein
MPDFKPKPGSFSTYLEYMQRDKKAEPSSYQASPLTLLEVLARQVQQALPVPDLQTLSGMEPARYHDALKSLLSAGYISIEGPTLEEVVKLTAKGEEVARLARPA